MQVRVAYDTSALDPLVAQYNSLKDAAANAIDVVVSRHRRGLKPKPQRALAIGARLGAWGRAKYGWKPRRVDAFELYAERLTHAYEDIGAAQESARKRAFPSAFVTFRSRGAQVVAAGALMSEDLTAWRCQAAPRPQEIFWPNLGLRRWERSARGLGMWLAFFLLVAFFMIPVTAVQALLSTNSLVR